jgi:pSer/pThr/pTyr-binding forkhead associated (FHA) protein
LQDIRLTRQKTVIGKSADADIQLNDQYASKLHAVIHFEEGKFFISDLGSSNHTRVNGEKILNQELKDGDKIMIGHQNIIFKRVRRNL